MTQLVSVSYSPPWRPARERQHRNHHLHPVRWLQIAVAEVRRITVAAVAAATARRVLVARTDMTTTTNVAIQYYSVTV